MGEVSRGRAAVFALLVIFLVVPCAISAFACRWILTLGVVACAAEWVWVFLTTRGMISELERAAWLSIGLLSWFAPSMIRVGEAVQGSWPGHLRTLECLVITLIISDSAQLLIGRRWGSRKAFPSISPSKTWEGYLGGVATAVLCASAIHGWPAGHAAAVVTSGCAGDLFFSAAKRRLGLKDFSAALGVHGGFCDRCDSFIFALNVLYAASAF